MRVIRLLYRKIIDASSQSAWEKLVFNDSYTEFLMQAQLYNQEKKYSTFGELITYVPNADKLHFLVSGSVVGYLKQLNRKVPDILNNSGKLFLPFSNYKFEIINSDIKDKSKHQVAVNFMSEPLTWYDTIGNQLLVALDTTPVNGEILTEQFAMQPFLSIYSLKEIK
ncbi:hypothetical protein SAMN05428988_0840 [Chitinophaga sp. YR573]|uniref:hypothetical protein n=1 Tax=Chitinophaga sp. YR573 TaxID=1881040 RepID=UPI0008D51AEF|nr:hypothetical protein [Chitinophaga sp. YR573]SEV96436.1 hypothetical protein SAMN05428988_0840 [Chitinophaga sp. YR573]